MNSRLVRTSAAAFVLLVCLAVAPVSSAQPQSRDRDFSEKVAKFVAKIQKLIGGITTHSDFPIPPVGKS